MNFVWWGKQRIIVVIKLLFLSNIAAVLSIVTITILLFYFRSISIQVFEKITMSIFRNGN